jgi:hypothetical protein
LDALQQEPDVALSGCCTSNLNWPGQKSVAALQAQLEFYAKSGEKARYEKALQQLRKLQSNL